MLLCKLSALNTRVWSTMASQSSIAQWQSVGFLCKGSQVQSWARYTFYAHIATCHSCSIYYLLYMMHLSIGAKPGLLSTFFSLVKKRLCSPELKHCLNVYSVLLCTLGMQGSPVTMPCIREDIKMHNHAASRLLQHSTGILIKVGCS